jgi:RHS repeat-associated protein
VVVTPDTLSAGSDTVEGGEFASLGLAAGDVQTSHDLPGYNPGVAPLSLSYDSAAADPQPVFLVHYTLDPSKAIPGTVSAQLTLNGVAGSTIYYNTATLNPGDVMQIALQANATSLSTGRYGWSIAVTANYSPNPVTTNYSGSVDIINDRTSAFGPGWTLANLERIYPVTGGVVLEMPGGRSLWFASNGSGGFITPAGDFSTLTLANGVYTRTLPDGTQITFDGTGKQTAIIDTNNNTTTFAWNGSGQLVTITDMNGMVTNLTYTNGLVTSISDPAGRNANGTQLAYTNGWLTSITDLDNTVWHYGYDMADDLTSLIDPRGFSTNFSYTAAMGTGVTRPDGTSEALAPYQAMGLPAFGTGTQGNPATAVLLAQAQALYTDPRLHVWTSALDWLGFGTTVQSADPLGDTTLDYRDPNDLAWLDADPLGRRQRDFFDSKGNPTKLVYADNTFDQYTYNSFSEPLTYTDALGNVTTDAYDSHGNLLTETLPVPAAGGTAPVYSWTYTSKGSVATATDPLNHTTTDGYDTRNRLTTETNPLSQTVTYGYDSASDLTTLTNALNKTWTYTYDNVDRMLTETLPVNNSGQPTFNFAYDYDGNQTSVSDPLGYLTSQTFDSMDRPLVTTDPLGHTTTDGYDAAGNLITVRDYLGRVITYGYDAADQETSVQDQNGNTTTFGYDAAGQQTSEIDPVIGTTTSTYTQVGLLASQTNPLNHTISYGYNADGWQTTITDALNHTTTSAYDNDGRLTTVTDPKNGVTSYTYNADGTQASVKDPANNTTSYGYDANAQLTTVTDPLGHQTSNGYDAAGELTSITDRNGRTRTFSYNADGWQTAENWLNGQGQSIYSISYGYDLDGRLTSASDPDSTYAYGYDHASRLTSVDNAGTPGVPHVVLTSGYDAVDNRTSLSDNLTGSVSFGWDNAHRLTSESLTVNSVAGPSVTLGYDAHDRLTSLTRSIGGAGNTISTNLGYDNGDRLTSISHTSSATGALASYSYGYDAANRLTSYTGPEGSLNYTYDSTNQLTGVTGARGENYSYDANGNRTMTGYSTGADNRLASDGTFNYTYDNEGNVITKTKISDGSYYTFTWDYRNRLTEVTLKNSQGVIQNDEKFTYDVNDHRIGVWANGAQQSWTVYDGDNPYLDFTGAGAVADRYLTDPNAIDAFFAHDDGNGNSAFYLTDNLGSVRELVNVNGGVLDALTYDSYGNILTETNAANGDRFKYAYGQYDAGLNLYLFDHRWYTPSAGRFLSEDPLGLVPDINPSRYVGNSPLSATDPSGTIPVPDALTAKKPPKTFDIPKLAQAGLGRLWDKTKKNEWGTPVFVTKKDPEKQGPRTRKEYDVEGTEAEIPTELIKRAIKMVGLDEVIVGFMHTHPVDVPPSPADIDFASVYRDKFNVSYVRTRSSVYVIVVYDPKLAAKVEVADLEKRWNRSMLTDKGNYEAALRAAVEGTGIAVYRAPVKGGFLPAKASLIAPKP